jgi:pimeloyl-ACP methyl ester carboxylesterase
MVTTELHTQTKKTDGLEIRYACSHVHDEPTVLLLSPWPESIYAWEQLWPRLTSAGRVVAIDLPGFGHSEGRTDLFSPQAMGRFVVRLIAEWQLGAPHIFGPDVGGPTALFAAVESPSSLTSAIVGNGATSYPLEVEGNLRDLIANPDFDSLLALDGAEITKQSMAMHETYEVSPAALEDYMTSYVRRRSPQGWLQSRLPTRDRPGVADLPSGARTSLSPPERSVRLRGSGWVKTTQNADDR